MVHTATLTHSYQWIVVHSTRGFKALKYTLLYAVWTNSPMCMSPNCGWKSKMSMTNLCNSQQHNVNCSIRNKGMTEFMNFMNEWMNCMNEFPNPLIIGLHLLLFHHFLYHFRYFIFSLLFWFTCLIIILIMFNTRKQGLPSPNLLTFPRWLFSSHFNGNFLNQ